MPLSRKHFLAAAAGGASVAAIPAAAAAQSAETANAHFHILKPGEYDHARMLRTLTTPKKHKQVFQASNSLLLAPGIATIYIHMQNSMNAHEFSFGMGTGSLATLGVLMGPSIVLALSDPMWTKYGFGDAFKLAPTNVYYRATAPLKLTGSPDAPNSVYQDWSAQAVMYRGGAFMVCHNAMTFVASVVARQANASPEAVLADFERHVLPGFQVVPAGVAAVQLAQQHGFTLFALA